ncbi:hypothetical protein cypCar_00037522 [Cyprinus carpio]|nr:hypothetical protein cypCar_00037522 [Cyprinus carpio]
MLLFTPEFPKGVTGCDPRNTIIKMEFIKEESEDIKIEETFKQEDTEEQTKMEFIKEESEEIKIEETFRVKREDTEEQTGWFLFSKLNSLL